MSNQLPSQFSKIDHYHQQVDSEGIASKCAIKKISSSEILIEAIAKNQSKLIYRLVLFIKLSRQI